jgi:hypothetical protein
MWIGQLGRRLRIQEFANEEISRDAANALFSVERMAGEKCAEWREFLADTIVERTSFGSLAQPVL